MPISAKSFKNMISFHSYEVIFIATLSDALTTPQALR